MKNPLTTIMVALVFIISFAGCGGAFKVTHDPTAENLTLTSANSALPHEAFKASIVLAYPIPTKLRAGERIAVHLIVKNESGVMWPSSGQKDGKYQIRVGNHWLRVSSQDSSSAGRDAIDDGRTQLAYDLQPGAEAEVLITITAPKVSGEYLLEFDVVQEQVAWFRDQGSRTLNMAMTVE